MILFLMKMLVYLLYKCLFFSWDDISTHKGKLDSLGTKPMFFLHTVEQLIFAGSNVRGLHIFLLYLHFVYYLAIFRGLKKSEIHKK